MRKLVLAFSLSALMAVNAVAVEPENMEGPQAAPAVAPVEIDQTPLYERVKNTVHKGLDDFGILDLAYGTGNCAKAAGGVFKDVGHTFIATTDLIGAISQITVAPFMLAYEGKDAAKKNLNTALEYLVDAGGNLKTAASDMPKNYENLKTGVTHLGIGGKKVYEAVTSETTKNATSKTLNAIKSGASSAWGAIKSVGAKVSSWFSKTFTPDFDNADFS